MLFSKVYVRVVTEQGCWMLFLRDVGYVQIMYVYVRTYFATTYICTKLTVMTRYIRTYVPTYVCASERTYVVNNA